MFSYSNVQKAFTYYSSFIPLVPFLACVRTVWRLSIYEFPYFTLVKLDIHTFIGLKMTNL